MKKEWLIEQQNPTWEDLYFKYTSRFIVGLKKTLDRQVPSSGRSLHSVPANAH
jgi:hypothetical protein